MGLLDWFSRRRSMKTLAAMSVAAALYVSAATVTKQLAQFEATRQQFKQISAVITAESKEVTRIVADQQIPYSLFSRFSACLVRIQNDQSTALISLARAKEAVAVGDVKRANNEYDNTLLVLESAIVSTYNLEKVNIAVLAWQKEFNAAPEQFTPEALKKADVSEWSRRNKIQVDSQSPQFPPDAIIALRSSLETILKEVKKEQERHRNLSDTKIKEKTTRISDWFKSLFR